MIIRHDKILYDPISWIHHQRLLLPDMMDNSQCRSILNSMIFDYYKLNAVAVNPNCRLEHMFVAHWQRLRMASFLLCCMRYRTQLAQNGGLMVLPKFARQFAVLDLPGSACETVEKVSIDDVWRRSAAEIFYFRNLLSESISCRLPLLFPTDSVEYAENYLVSTPAIFSLKLAIQHVVHNE